MSGVKTRRNSKNRKGPGKVKNHPPMDETPEHEASEHHASEHDGSDALRAGFSTISKEIKDLKLELRQELSTFKDEIKKELREDITYLRQELDRKLTENNKELQAQRVSIAEAQDRISDVEEWKTEVNEVMSVMMEQTRLMQGKLTDLEGRSRRNNIRVFCLPEGTEGSSTAKYMESLLKTELEIPEETRLQIQRAHRALARKPNEGSTPRSIVSLGKQIFFDHDYPTAVVQKRRAYSGIKKMLKEKGIRFQMPLTKIHIQWNTGVKTYDNAREAAQDMKERGHTVDVPGENTEPAWPRGPAEWKRVAGRGRGSDSGTADRAREKLQSYQWKS
ncbi:hypothetical protein JOQ06_024061 [Pogonophryne albipinna]|uniref:L1 transposable element RRM domain-containing protein n=1 Tax=Pogonophryne albipinna TaxID=1090488 RepID=A0AAD6BNR1_9TELE|nr:hypothetical protein JOQ06_024061 [Pogonophryne albipinna]